MLWGDIASAVETHNMLYQATLRNKFLPEVREKEREGNRFLMLYINYVTSVLKVSLLYQLIVSVLMECKGS